jgi:hypothetical protein
MADHKARIRGHINTSIEAISFHMAVTGTMSQYHTVVIVTSHHHREAGIEVKLVQYKLFSMK